MTNILFMDRASSYSITVMVLTFEVFKKKSHSGNVFVQLMLEMTMANGSR